MSTQLGLFGMDSYKEIRKPVKGQQASAMQIALFPLAKVIKATTVALKKGQRYMVEKTNMIVTFIKRSGQTTIWACDGHLYRINDIVLERASIQEMTARSG